MYIDSIMADYAMLLLKYYGDKKWRCGNTYESIEWIDETTDKPTQEKLDELAVIDQVREVRDQLLKESDFRLLSDYAKDKEGWIEYRQKLRDLPSIWVKDMAFPTPPSD